MPKILRLILAVLLCEGAGILGSLFTISSIPTWYATLNKPFFSPPNSIFGPVWTILYLLMGVALFLIWENKGSKGRALQVFFIQLGLNVLWSLVFFGAHQLLLSLIIIVALWYFIFQTIKAFARINKTASYLLYPYLTWVSFALILNLGIVILNR